MSKKNQPRWLYYLQPLLLLILFVMAWGILQVSAATTPTTEITQPTPTPTPPLLTSSQKSDLPVPTNTANIPKPSGASGDLKVLSWAGFKAAGSYTFDDNTQSQIDNFSALMDLKVPMTFYIWTNQSTASNSVWSTAVSRGHELGNHTVSHPQNGNYSEIEGAQTFMRENFGVKPLTMAAPYGSSSYQKIARPYFLVNRGVGGMVNTIDTDPYNLGCFIPNTDAPADAMSAYFNQAVTSEGWTIMLIHGFTGTSDGAYQPVSIKEFASSVNTVKGYGMWLDTVLNIAAYLRAHKMMQSVAPTKSGSDLIYRWTLPAHFPSNRYLRVTVAGGTLKQNNQILRWDAHGYYEISLDAGSLTISPENNP